ncbi:MAG TPA: ABC transporter substrate-binding protein [Candidatus Limnocylindria bacterium]|nr:ABC transporter substrate-binding protein [Candidatus Limnocylindria bacterium]
MRTYRTFVLGAAMLALLLSACSSGEGNGSSADASTPAGSQAAGSQAADLPEITIGSAGFWESAVVAEIYAQALEKAGFTVERELELGARDVTHPALVDGQIDIMPEYIGGYLAVTYGGEPTSDVEESLEALRTELEADGLVALEPTPGTDADGFAVRQETADELGLATMSDLAEVADQLRWGVAQECAENPNCGPGLERVYGIDFDSLDVETLGACNSAIAEALNANNIDVAQVCTTQPEIAAFGLVLLEDDKGLAPAQNIVPVVRQELMDAAGDLIESTLNPISELLTTEELTNLGNQVVINGESYEDAAAQWLEDNGF